MIDTIADKNLGDADFQPDVTNSAGLPYILSTTTTAVCTVANNAVTLVATGTCTVKADAPATPAYNAATQQSKSFMVAAARAPLVYYVHPDQIGSPRVMTKATDNSIVWKWDNEEAFGDNLPNEKPSGTGERFKYDLRFAGQVYDKETATSYNYFRDYVPGLGGYQQSDPIGLLGGINTYAYVGGSPLGYSDPLGLIGPLVQFGTWAAQNASAGLRAAQAAYYRYGPAAAELIAGVSGVNGTAAAPMSPLASQIPTSIARLTPAARAVAEGIDSGAYCAANSSTQANVLQKALAQARPTGGHPQQVMTRLDDGTRVLFRRDFGAQSHSLGGPFKGAGPVNHYNVEVQSQAGKMLQNVHIVPDGNGGYIWWSKGGVPNP